MSHYTTESTDESLDDEREIGATYSKWRLDNYVHSPPSDCKPSFSNMSAHFRVDGLTPKERKRVQCQKRAEKKRLEVMAVKREVEAFRAVQAFVKTWMDTTDWLSRQSEPTLLRPDAESLSDESSPPLPQDILVSTSNGTELGKLSDIVESTQASQDASLRLWMPVTLNGSHSADGPMETQSSSSPVVRQKKSRVGSGGYLKADITTPVTERELRVVERRRYQRDRCRQKTTEHEELCRELAEYRSDLPLMQACKRFFEVWQPPIDSVFDDFAAGGVPLSLRVISHTEEGAAPMPSGIIVEAPGGGSRWLGETWAGEALDSPMSRWKQLGESALNQSQYSSAAVEMDDAGGLPLTAERLATLGSELAFARLVAGTYLDPNHLSR